MKNKIFLVAILLVIAGALFIYNGSFLSASLTQPQKETQITLPESKELAKGNKTTKSEENKKKDKSKQDNEILGFEKINEMEKEDLMQIDGIGNVTAKKILEAEEIETRKDLMEIDGIGEVTTEKIEEYVSSWDKNSKNNNNKSNEKKIENEFKAETKSSVTLTEKELEVIFRAMKKSEINSEEKELKDKKNVLRSESTKENQPEEINLNKANSKQLQKLIGIGPAYASRIINARPFCNVDELVKVNGIGDSTLKNIKDQNLAIANCSNSTQSNKNNVNKDQKQKIEEKEEKIEELENEIEELKNKNEELNEENEDLEEEIDDLENSLEDSRDRLTNEKSNDKNLKKKLEEARIKRDACKFESQNNINIANKTQLKEVDGVGDSISEDILNFVDNSPINHFEQLTKIDGIGSVIISNFVDSNFCAEDPIIDENNSSDDDNGSSEVNKYNVSFTETNGLKNVEIKLYDSEDQSNPIKTITTDNNGEVEQELEEGGYWFTASLEEYEDYTGDFSLTENIEKQFQLDPVPQNLLKNQYLNNWTDNSINNWNWGNRKELKNKKPLIDEVSYFKHEPYSSYKDLTQSVSVEKDKSYHVNVWVKGKGNIKAGFIKDEQENWNSHSYTEINTEEWKKLSFQIEDNQFENAKFALRLKRLSDTGESLSIGAVWLSQNNPPENWLNNQ